MAKIENAKKIWAQEEKLKAQQARIDAAKARSAAYDGPETVEAAEAQSDWELLSTIGAGRFPDHLALKFDLTWIERRVCIARCVGWTLEKIALAAGKDRTTIARWLDKQPAKDFIAAFEYHSGTRDTKELIDKEVYNSLQVLVELRDNPQTSASTRADIAWKFIESKYGKAKETKEVKGVNLRDLTEQLRQTNAEDVIADVLGESLPDLNKAN